MSLVLPRNRYAIFACQQFAFVLWGWYNSTSVGDRRAGNMNNASTHRAAWSDQFRFSNCIARGFTVS